VLALVTGGWNGLGLNPWPTWDWPHTTTIVDVFVPCAQVLADLLATRYANVYDSEPVRRHASCWTACQSTAVSY